jgi:hypothetical protein
MGANEPRVIADEPMEDESEGEDRRVSRDRKNESSNSAVR